MTSRPIETGYNIAISIQTNWILSFVSVSKRFIHTHNWIHYLINKVCIKATDSNEIFPNLSVLQFKLFLIGQALNLTTTTLLCHRTLNIYTERGRFDYFHQSGKAITFFHLGYSSFDLISHHCILDEICHTFKVTDASPFHAHIFNFYNKLIIFVHLYSNIFRGIIRCTWGSAYILRYNYK